jgi:hypothetical protein
MEEKEYLVTRKSLSLEEMLELSKRVKFWRATLVSSPYEEEEYNDLIAPHVYEFEGRVEDFTLTLSRTSAGYWYTHYGIIVDTPSICIGNYLKGRKASPQLIKLFSDLESEHTKNYWKSRKANQTKFLEKAKKLIRKK